MVEKFVSRKPTTPVIESQILPPRDGDPPGDL
jgi:hypothetical protein